MCVDPPQRQFSPSQRVPTDPLDAPPPVVTFLLGPWASKPPPPFSRHLPVTCVPNVRRATFSPRTGGKEGLVIAKDQEGRPFPPPRPLREGGGHAGVGQPPDGPLCDGRGVRPLGLPLHRRPARRLQHQGSPPHSRGRVGGMWIIFANTFIKRLLGSQY